MVVPDSGLAGATFAAQRLDEGMRAIPSRAAVSASHELATAAFGSRGASSGSATGNPCRRHMAWMALSAWAVMAGVLPGPSKRPFVLSAPRTPAASRPSCSLATLGACVYIAGGR